MLRTSGGRVIIGSEDRIKPFRDAHPELRVWGWEVAQAGYEELRRLDPGVLNVGPIRCVWGPEDGPAGPFGLPASATQFSVDPRILPAFFRWVFEELPRRWAARAARAA